VGQRSKARGVRAGAVVAIVALAMLASACGGPTARSSSDGYHAPVRIPAATPTPDLPVTVTSADGTKVTIRDVSRIVPLWTNLSEVVYSIGLGPNVVGRDTSTTFAPANRLPAVTRGHDLSAEAVLSLKPTLVLADDETGPPEALAQIRAAGVPVVVFPRANRVEDIQRDIVAVADAVGLPGQGDRLARQTQRKLGEAQRSVPHAEHRPRVAFLYLRGTAGVYLIGGPGSGADSMIDAAGGTDAGTAMGLRRPFTPITSEAMVQAAPDVILTTSTGLASVGGIDGLLGLAGIAQTPAGQDRRIITQDDGALYSFGARTPEVIEHLVADIHRGVR
jgi:iron complex transport system substrate-binding protein